ncbi:TonB-dependent receptor domain-containing protein [Campylobacter curvus]|uniref:TonB-dependent receptor domain-containing protein n=1 Tax=Campylobacter curvus TaxID=200 RepID=UPI0003625244|nr:TonB-dependent receptor [Campylobacter curvus]QKF61934.1 TonB-dependent hemoglobin/transferrin/lactoferrin receptor family protein [Campylobacter curvus]UEB50224.1 TonB-dependent receptor [Campylobacter curvus]
MSGNRLKLSLIALLILNAGGLFAADEKDVKLDSIEVIGTTPDDDVKTKKVGETKKSAETLSKQQVSDSRDLVKYETGVTVVEAGRFGASGYAIRGVDENRVAITIDGLHQAETLSSQGFRELFEGYGNFNNTRNGVEMENVKLATITKGADSIKTGSGALGGSVMFETKDARDYLIDKNWYFGFKNGYQSRDSQNFRSISAAARVKWFDILVINTNRNGHETKNYFYDIYSPEEDRHKVGREREKVDPYNITRKSTMIKIGFQPSEEHRFSVMHDDSKIGSVGEDFSYTLRPSTMTNIFYDGGRVNNDKSTRTNTQYTYESFVETPFWDSFKISYSKQKITNTARTDEFCTGSECREVQNPQGLHIDSGGGAHKTVDKSGNELTAEYDYGTTIKNSAGQELHQGTDYQEYSIERTYLDCSKIDCTKKFKVLQKTDEEWSSVYRFVERDIEIIERNGKKYGYIKTKTKDLGWTTAKEDTSFIVPGRAGRHVSFYNDRDLNTDTKQFNIDFDKEFTLLGTEHSMKYGMLYSKTNKSMVNKDGFRGGNIQWWSDWFIGSDSTPDANGIYQPNPGNWPNGSNVKQNTNDIHSYLVPVTTKTSAFYIGDDMKIADWLGFDLNYRYDKVKHQPKYNSNIPIPHGMIVGIFVPVPYNCDPYANGAYNSPCVLENLRQNLAILLQDKEFKSDSYSLGVNLDPLSFMRFQVKYSKGFRAPTADEMYMTFKHPSFSISPNINLKAEIAKTKEAALTFYKNQSFASFSVFKTDYENFIDLAYLGEKPVDIGSGIAYPFWQNINRDKAKVTGFEINSRLELDEISSSLRGFRVGYKFTHQKGRMNDTIPMNAIQPTTSVYTLGYSTPGDKYGIDFYITDVGEKKADDTYNMYWESQRDAGKIVKGKPVTDSTIAWRSGNYTILDMIAYAKPIKNFTFGFGLYNITDQKYMTWDLARSIRAVGTNNMINQDTGVGIKRFYAPGRNFKFTWEIKF